ncbi:MAG: ribbon-helix-helix protein, CopG family [Thermoleophilaceae bacterium]|jgi:hypothetical protein|nr:ribbon-helix-helix protein, CopG family [Thermoleophilaceae bacterium]MBA3838825.1 ribbon-helix-helix protein, CopG family [Thermoleophilaceae bacterium]
MKVWRRARLTRQCSHRGPAPSKDASSARALPDALLDEIDAEAGRRGTTRSALLRTFVDEALTRRSSRRAERITEIMKGATPHGGNALELLKRERQRR